MVVLPNVLWATCSAVALFVCLFLPSCACAASQACGGEARTLTQEKQRALIDQYAQALANANAREHMARVHDCLAKLSAVFRLRFFDDIGDTAQVASEAERLLTQIAASLCSELLRKSAEERAAVERRLWDLLGEGDGGGEWRSLLREIVTGNGDLAGACRRRLSHVLDE